MLLKATLNPNFNTPESKWPPHDRPAACVITQQYSSTTYISLCLLHHTEKFSRHFKKLVPQFFYFFRTVYDWNCVTWNCIKLWSVCTQVCVLDIWLHQGKRSWYSPERRPAPELVWILWGREKLAAPGRNWTLIAKSSSLFSHQIDQVIPVPVRLGNQS